MSTLPIHARFDIRRGGFTLKAELTLPGRGVTAFFGHSGAGKTTLLRAIAGLEQHRGSLSINGEIWQDDNSATFVPAHRRALGYVFQEASLLPHLSVRRNLEYGWARTPAADRRIEWEPTLAMLGIGHLLDRPPSALSGGERQRVAIARALLASPKLLLMDEPLASLDAARKEEVLPYLERIHDELEIPVIYVSHAADEVARLADHVVLLQDGKVLASAAIAEISARLDLPTAFEESAGIVVSGIVESYDAAYGIAQVRIGEGAAIRVTHAGIASGASMRIRILARDVGIMLSGHRDTSVLNQLPARIVDAVPAQSQAHMVLRLDAGDMPLLARITRQSYDHLELDRHRQVWVQFKATAVFA